MTSISKAWVAIADGAVDPDSPVDTTLMTGFRDDLVHLREWLGASFTAGAVQDHNHDGVNSALVEVGSNMLRNGSFEAGTAGWTTTAYTGGSITTGTGNATHGLTGLAITSTVLANGGGYATSNEYLPIAAGQTVAVKAVMHASAVGVSSKIEVVWYNSAKAQISITAAATPSSTNTSPYDFGAPVVAPANAKFFKVRVTGGVPGVGFTTGTIYIDGVFCTRQVAAIDYQEFTSSGTWYKPEGLSGNESVIVELWGGGGGSNIDYAGGGGGGYFRAVVKASELGATESVTVGAGGSTTTSGGTSTFSGFSAYGGGKAILSTDYLGGGGGGSYEIGGTGSASTSGKGGDGRITVGPAGVAPSTAGTSSRADSGGSGACSLYGTAPGRKGGTALWWGGGGGGAGAVADGGDALYGGGGGSAGGGVGGVSVYGGNGGAHTVVGTAPGGGGGSLAAGARGEVRVWVIR